MLKYAQQNYNRLYLYLTIKDFVDNLYCIFSVRSAQGKGPAKSLLSYTHS